MAAVRARLATRLCSQSGHATPTKDFPRQCAQGERAAAHALRDEGNAQRGHVQAPSMGGGCARASTCRSGCVTSRARRRRRVLFVDCEALKMKESCSAAAIYCMNEPSSCMSITVVFGHIGSSGAETHFPGPARGARCSARARNETRCFQIQSWFCKVFCLLKAIWPKPASDTHVPPRVRVVSQTRKLIYTRHTHGTRPSGP